MKKNPVSYSAKLLKRSWLSKYTFEIEFMRPAGFRFVPGQRVRLSFLQDERDYSLITSPEEPHLGLCIRNVEGGRFSPLLASMEIGTELQFTGPLGYFTYRSASRPAVFVATGTGIAPFVSMARSGLHNFTLLHGARAREELYYADLFRGTAENYIPCLSGKEIQAAGEEFFRGRVTDYLSGRIPALACDFYLCGRSDMIRDATLLVDERFPGSYVYTEIYF